MLDLTKIEPISKEPFEFGPIQTKWLEALESGEYKQAQGKLKTPHGYCCLGVLCEVMGLEAHITGSIPFAYFRFGKSESSSYVPSDAVEGLGLRGSPGDLAQPIQNDAGHKFTDLTALNDEARLSFPEIAAYIRHDPHNVFKAAA